MGSSQKHKHKEKHKRKDTEHGTKKHKERKSEKKKHKRSKRDRLSSASDGSTSSGSEGHVSQQQQAATESPAAPPAAAQAAAQTAAPSNTFQYAPPSTSAPAHAARRTRFPPPPVPASLVQEQRRLGTYEPSFDFSGVPDGEDEVWVMCLPEGVKLEALEGCRLHLPTNPPEPRHLQPLPNPFEDPTADLLEYVKQAIPTTWLGHMQLDHEAAKENDVQPYRELFQLDEMTVRKIGVVAPTSEQDSQTPQLLKAARLIFVSDDIFTLGRQQLALVMEARNCGAFNWQDGWDGQLPPRKHRKRIAGWRVIGIRPKRSRQSQLGSNSDYQQASSDSDADNVIHSDISSEEEFDEEVFGAEKEQEKRAKAAEQGLEHIVDSLTGGCGGSDDQPGDKVDQEPIDAVDWDERWYSDHSEQGSGVESDGGDIGPFGVQIDPSMDTAQFLLSLPIRPDVANHQLAVQRFEMLADTVQEGLKQAAAAIGSAEELYAHENAAIEAAAAAAAQAKALMDRNFGDISDITDSEDGQVAGAPGILTQDDYAAYTQPADAVTTAGQQTSAEGMFHDPEAAADLAAAVNDALGPGSADDGTFILPPRSIPEMLDLGWKANQAFESMQDPQRMVLMRNKLLRDHLDWGEICAQVDHASMSDEQAQILATLATQKVSEQLSEGEDSDMVEPEEHAARSQVSCLLLPGGDPAPRPRFTAVDPEYVPYQRDGASPVGSPRKAAWREIDTDLADWLVRSGAGRQARFVHTSELRAKGFEWDSDPEMEQREGMQIDLPDGRIVHIPTALW